MKDFRIIFNLSVLFCILPSLISLLVTMVCINDVSMILLSESFNLVSIFMWTRVLCVSFSQNAQNTKINTQNTITIYIILLLYLFLGFLILYLFCYNSIQNNYLYFPQINLLNIFHFCFSCGLLLVSVHKFNKFNKNKSLHDLSVPLLN